MTHTDGCRFSVDALCSPNYFDHVNQRRRGSARVANPIKSTDDDEQEDWISRWAAGSFSGSDWPAANHGRFEYRMGHLAL